MLTGVGLSLALALLPLGLTACSVGGGGNQVELTLVSFAVTRAAYKEIIPQFAAQWKQDHGQEVVFRQSYGASGSQARAVIDGLPADIVDLSLALDIQKIEKAGLIQPDWEQEIPNGAIAHTSVAVLVPRLGNPKGISGWADLARDDVQIVTANPKTSGGARWNFLALWGAMLKTGRDEANAFTYATEVFENAPVLPRDAREATDVFFKQEQGDVLINYENELILARLNGKDLPYEVPDVNIAIESPVAIVDANVDRHGNREVAEAFIQFLFTPEAQRSFAKVGFRPVDPTVAAEFAAQYPKIQSLFTIHDLGGWNAAQEKFFADGAIFDQIQSSLGRS